jgi:hypothetical protein
MILKELIEMLEQYPADRRVAKGFAYPHSYRGFYDEVAFEPVDNITVGEMLKDAKRANGETYEGWKGGFYKMGDYTECWIAERGKCGDQISERLLGYLLADTVDGPLTDLNEITKLRKEAAKLRGTIITIRDICDIAIKEWNEES